MDDRRDAGPAPSRFRFTFGTLTRVMDSIGTVWVFILLIIINLDIGGRALFNSPLRGVPEIVSLSIVALVFLQLANTLRVGRLTRSDFVLGWLHKTRPRLGSALEGLFHLVGAALLVILFYASVPMFTKAWRIMEYVGAEGDFKAPVWPVKLIILIGCAVTCLQFVALAWRDFNLALGKATPPES